MQSDPSVNGVDVAKDELVVGCLGRATVQHISNDAAAIKTWLRRLTKGSIVAMESTGIYHQLLAGLAHAAGMRVYVLNAQDVYFYSKGLGSRSKTDRVDAGVITRYVAEHHERLHQWKPPSPRLAQIDELIRRRAVVVAKRDALHQTLRGCKGLVTAARQLDGAFNTLLRVIDNKIKAIFKEDQELLASQRRLATVIGFGSLGSALLAVLLARMPFATADALVAYSGLDPRPKDSGRHRGIRKISKRGPGYLRRQWYMAGFAAARSKSLRPAYQALRERGFASTEAFVILGRKLLRAAYAVWKSGLPFDLTKFASQPQTA